MASKLLKNKGCTNLQFGNRDALAQDVAFRVATGVRLDTLQAFPDARTPPVRRIFRNEEVVHFVALSSRRPGSPSRRAAESVEQLTGSTAADPGSDPGAANPVG